jgi:hypothetical protein
VKRNVLQTIKRRKANWIGHILHRTCLLRHVFEGQIEGRTVVTARRWRRPKQLLDDLKENRWHCKLKEEALDRTVWRSRFGIGEGLVRRTAEWMSKPSSISWTENYGVGTEGESLYITVLWSLEATKSFRRRKHRSKNSIEMYLTGKYVDSTGSGLRISVSPGEHGNGKWVSIAAQELAGHLSNYTVTCGYCSTGSCLLKLHFTHLWALFPSAQRSLWLPFPVHPPTLRPSSRPPVAVHRVELYVGRTAFFGLLSFMITEPMLAATWTEVGISIQQCFSRYYNIDLSRKNGTFTAAIPKLFFLRSTFRRK